MNQRFEQWRKQFFNYLYLFKIDSPIFSNNSLALLPLSMRAKLCSTVSDWATRRDDVRNEIQSTYGIRVPQSGPSQKITLQRYTFSPGGRPQMVARGRESTSASQWHPTNRHPQMPVFFFQKQQLRKIEIIQGSGTRCVSSRQWEIFKSIQSIY